MPSKPLIFAVKRGSLDDGEGIRTVFFLKGCPLRCSWCHNPESWDGCANITLAPDKCLGCGRCGAACSTGAFAGEGPPRIDAGRCRRCGACADACISGALQRVGAFYSHEALCDIVREDRAFHAASGGGVTFSGGEPLAHMEYVGKAAARLHAEGVPVCVQTCGEFAYAAFRRHVARFIDVVYFDVKLMDPEEHARHTGRSNRRILDNLERLAGDGASIVPRTPLIPGITDTKANLEGIAAFLERLGLAASHVLLPCNMTRKRAVVTLI
jgi:glycyl-radical enzyme activating protein family